MNQQIFREYDIRGVVGKDLTDETVQILARAVGMYFRQNGAQRVALGYDARESSPRFRDFFAVGLTACGLDVWDIGLVPTPLVYFSLFTESVDAGVMITGSHNPSRFNGFKLCLDGSTIFGEQIQAIRLIAEKDDSTNGVGRVEQREIANKYLDHVAGNVSLGSRKLKVVVDAGNGVGGIIGVPLYRRLGCETVDLFIEPDGAFPNHHPDPTDEKNLQPAITAVRENQADLAIVFDGDGDRIGVVDENGNVIQGDELTAIFAREILHNSPQASIIGEVKCSQRLFDDIEKRGGRAIMSRVGHSPIKAKMKEIGAVLAGEMSGHIFFADRYFGYDDAIYAGARLLEILSKTERNLSEFLLDLSVAVNTPEIRVECDDELKFKIVAQLKTAFKQTNQVIEIDGARILFDDGWALVRASNTEPVLAMRFEATSQIALEKIRQTVETAVDKLLTNL